MESWNDFGKYLPQAWRTVKECREMCFMLIGCYVVVAIFSQVELISNLVRILSIYPFVVLAAMIIQDSLRIEGFQSETMEKSVLPISTVFFVSLVYNVLAGILSLLLIAPGIWWMARYCLSAVVAVAEQKAPFACLSTSASLTKGHFAEIIRYMSAPVILLVLYFIVAIVFPKFDDNLVFSSVIRFAKSLAAMVIQFGALPMLVHLYMRLSANQPASTGGA